MKDGYRTASTVQPTQLNHVARANLIAGGFIGIAVEASTRANFDYPEDFSLTLMTTGPARMPPMAPCCGPRHPYAQPPTAFSPNEPGPLYPAHADKTGL